MEILLPDLDLPDFKYWYGGTVVSVYDADTIRVKLDLGLGLKMAGLGIEGKGISLRLFGIDAFEVRGSERPHGLEARDFVRELIDSKQLIINTILDKTGKYGRLLARIFVEIEPGLWLDLNQELVNNGYARLVEY